MPIEIATSERVEVVDVTQQVASEIPDDADGIATVFVQHTTAGITVNEAESRLLGDVEDSLAELVPEDGGWAHDAIDDNADSHLRAMLVGNGPTIPVEDGDLMLGTWQSVLLVECDGPRTRRVQVAVAE